MRGEYDEAQQQDPIYVKAVRLRDGRLSYALDGGRHRVAAAVISGRGRIGVDLNARSGYLHDSDREKFRAWTRPQ
jgi:hypothetical protein